MNARSFNLTLVKSLLIFAAICLVHPGVCLATDRGQTTSTVKVHDVLSDAYFRSVYYEIADDVERSDYFYRFRVISDFGSFDVSSVSMLQIRLYEILTISEVMQQLRRSGLSLDRAPPGRRGVGGESVADILSNPLGTAGQLLGNLRYNLEETFVEQPVVEHRGLVDRNKEATNDPGPHKRSAAAQLGVDVYSSNRRLQGVLDVLAEARSSGKLRQSVVPAQTRLISPPPFGSGALDTRLRSQLKNSSAAEINEYIDARLQSFKVGAAERIGLLTHQSYTPRSRLYFTAYLAQFSKAKDLHNMVRAAVSATTETDALAFTNLARMAAFLHLKGNPIRQIVMRHNFPILLTAQSELVLALPIDYFDWSDNSAGLVKELDGLRQAESAVAVSIVIAGSVSERAKAELDARRIQIQEYYSF